MRPNPLLPSCFWSSPLSHLSWDVAPPKSPSSIILLDERPHDSKKMYAVTNNWFLENDIFLPTKPHLHDYCRRVATLLKGDRVVCFICTSPESVGSCSVSVHLSRIQTHGGKLLELVLPNVSKSSSKLVIVELKESALGMLAISDYLYRSHIDFAGLNVSNTFEIASAANRWECHDLFIGSLLHLVYKQRLSDPLSIPPTVSLRWLSQAPRVFLQYLSNRAEVVLPLLNFQQITDVLRCAHFTSMENLCDQVLQFIIVNDLVQTKFDVLALLTIYNEVLIPSNFKEYFAMKMAHFFFQINTERNHSDTLSCDNDYESSEVEHFNSASYCTVRGRSLIKILHNNTILLETLRQINESTSNGYDAQNLFWTILHHAEPLIPDKDKVVAILQRICASVDDREGLVSNESAWNHLSGGGMRIAALSLCSRRSYSPALQFSVNISWDSLTTGSSIGAAVGSIDGVKFELKARSSTKRICSWRLYYSNVEGCFEPRTDSYARVKYELVNSNCSCDDIRGIERMTKLRLKDRNFRNGSVRDLHTEGELTILNEEDVEDWCSRHQQSCALSIFVRIEL